VRWVQTLLSPNTLSKKMCRICGSVSRAVHTSEFAKRTGENPMPGRKAEEEGEAGASHAVRSQAEPGNEEIGFGGCVSFNP
jgi:hypothetical protein